MSAIARAANARTEARRDRLIDAAQAVFAREGLRGASMERIAAEAGVARATAYAYFSDKEDAFRQVASRLAEQMAQRVQAELARSEPLALRIRAALQAKHEMVFRVARQSPFAADLFAAKDRLAGPAFVDAEKHIVAALAASLAELGIADPRATAHVLHAASTGVANAAQDLATLTVQLALFVDAMLGGLESQRS
jgi:AcrR family transcriptional regulator